MIISILILNWDENRHQILYSTSFYLVLWTYLKKTQFNFKLKIETQIFIIENLNSPRCIGNYQMMAILYKNIFYQYSFRHNKICSFQYEKQNRIEASLNCFQDKVKSDFQIYLRQMWIFNCVLRTPQKQRCTRQRCFLTQNHNDFHCRW